MRRKWLASLLALTLLLSLFPTAALAAEGDADTGESNSMEDVITPEDENGIMPLGGEEETPVETDVTEIATAQDLLDFAKAVNDGNDFTGKTVKLTANIDLTDVDWTPIGGLDASKNFAGTFDGNDKTISNLTMELGNKGGDKTRAGLFASPEGAKIQNLTLENTKITGTGTDLRVGALGGNIWNNTTVEKVTIDGFTFEGTATHVGGMTGIATNANFEDITLKKITLTADKCGYVGGMIGSAQTAYVNKLTATDITINGTDSNPMGGVIGYAQGNCSAEHPGTSVFYGDIDRLTITAGGTKGSQIGGITGTTAYNGACNAYRYCTIKNLSVTVDNDIHGCVGGVVGYQYGMDMWYLVDRTSFDQGNTVSGTISGGNSSSVMGGYVGAQQGRVRDYVDCTANVNINTEGTAGGFCGSAQNTHDNTFGKGDNSSYRFTDCTAAGEVVGAKGRTGGFIGSITNDNGRTTTITFNGCESNGTVNGETASITNFGGYTEEGSAMKYSVASVTTAAGQKTYYDSFKAALAAATDGSTIDLLGNTIACKDDINANDTDGWIGCGALTIQNGTFDFSGASANTGLLSISYNKAGNLIFNDVTFTGNTYRSYSTIQGNATDKVIFNGCTFDLKNASNGHGVLKDGSFVLNGCTMNVDNIERLFVSATLDIKNSTINAKYTSGTNKTAFRDAVGTIDNSTITIEGFDYGVENDHRAGGLKIQNNSRVTITGSNTKDLLLTTDDKIIVDGTSTLTYDTADENTKALTFNADGGRCSVSKIVAKKGTVIDLRAYTPTRTGYTFNGWYLAETKVESVTLDADQTIVAKWTENYVPSGGSSGPSYYTISVDKTEDGGVTTDRKSASTGTTVTITVEPDEGYTLESLTVLDKNGKEIKLTDKGNGKYTFTMPAGKVEIKASFAPEKTAQNFFTDVPAGSYYEDAVLWAAQHEITGGVGNNLFAPDLPCTRAQIVTFLWRAAGSPEPTALSAFTDIPADAYYAKAVAWAVEKGITDGVGDNKFAPDLTCTRAQAVTFLFRANGSPAVSGNANFTDIAADAYYAQAVAWAAENDVTGGIGGGQFGPDLDCTRAQIATFLYRSAQD